MQIVVRYHEIALKGRNRPFFVDKLVRNLRRATSDLGDVRVAGLAGRVSLDAPDGVDAALLRERVARVFGVANFSPVHEAPAEADLRTLRAGVVAALRARPFASFCVRARRSDKSFPRNSGQIERELGAAIFEATGVHADLTHPALTVFVEILHDRIFYSFEKLPGAGGFPVGSSGRVAALLSGGIDSPVAAWRLMKRGCTVILVNFHAFPLQDRTMIDKVRELARVLTRWQLGTKLLLVPFGSLQQEVVAACPAPLRVVLYRRFMVRIAGALARRHAAKALVTGESLGQVASQTLDNLATIDEAASLPVLRPLIGMDKDEITAQAQRIGTFEVSTLPDQDCCQLFVPRSPATAARVEEVRVAESALDVDALVARAVAGAEIERFTFPGRGEAPAEKCEPV
jgi:thiamine biosynthesis protein ThiI